MNKAIFLDRDGVINHDPGDYTKSLSEFHILPDVMPALKRMNELGYMIILITNQGGVAKGLYSLDDVYEIHNFFLSECAKNNVEISDIFFSPHHDSTGKSLTRKPGSLMVERAIARYNIDPANSLMIGDKQRDLDAAAGASVDGILIEVNSSLLNILPQIEKRS